MPHKPEPLTRFYIRGVGALARRKWLRGVEGLKHVAPESDPFVIVSNHSQRPETLILNSLLAFHRGGRLVHYLADWPMMLVPGVATMYRRGGVIPVFGKKPKVRALARMEGRFRRRYPGSAWERALRLLQAGRSVGVFPESTMNRNRNRMLRGRPGAALLALQAGVPLVPMGVRFDAEPADQPISDLERFSVHIGAPIETEHFAADAELSSDRTADDAMGDEASRARLHSASKELHQVLMRRVSELCGKTWRPGAARRKEGIGTESARDQDSIDQD